MNNEENMSGQELLSTIVIIASVAHEVNRAFNESIGDSSIQPWETAPMWQKQSSIDGVGYVLSNQDASPAEVHKNWVAQRTRDGWVYGPEKDEALKIHPCLVPYEELPTEEKSKDYIFRATVISLAKTFGLI